MSKVYSKNIMVYPCAFRGKHESEDKTLTNEYVFDPSARMFTEKNNKGIYENLITYNKSKDDGSTIKPIGSKIISKDWSLTNSNSEQPFKFILYGYQFTIYNPKEIFSDSSKDYYAHIVVEETKQNENKEVSSTRLLPITSKNELINSLSLDSKDISDNQYYFDGLIIDNSPSTKIKTSQSADSYVTINTYSMQLTKQGEAYKQNNIMFTPQDIVGSIINYENLPEEDLSITHQEFTLNEALDTNRLFTDLITSKGECLLIKTNKGEENIQIHSANNLEIKSVNFELDFDESKVVLKNGDDLISEADKDNLNIYSKHINYKNNIVTNTIGSAIITLNNGGSNLNIYSPNTGIDLGKPDSKINKLIVKDIDANSIKSQELEIIKKALFEGVSTFKGKVLINNNLEVNSDTTINGICRVNNTLIVDRRATVSGELEVQDGISSAKNICINNGSDLQIADGGAIRFVGSNKIDLGGIASLSSGQVEVDSSENWTLAKPNLNLKVQSNGSITAESGSYRTTLINSDGSLNCAGSIHAARGYNLYQHTIRLYGDCNNDTITFTNKNKLDGTSIEKGDFHFVLSFLCTRSNKFTSLSDLLGYFKDLPRYNNEAIEIIASGYGGNDKDKCALYATPYNYTDTLLIYIETNGNTRAAGGVVIVNKEALTQANGKGNQELGFKGSCYRIGSMPYTI